MIKFEVTGETWKEILEKLDGMLTPNDTHIKSVTDTIEEPENSFKTEVKPPVLPERTDVPDTTEEPAAYITNPAYVVDPPIKKPPGRSPKSTFPDKYKLPFGELDSANQPFDKNIHARTKTKTADGRWKLKRPSPGFAKKEVTSTPVIVTPKIPDFTQPPAKVIDTQQRMIDYLTKINESGKADYTAINEYFQTQSIVNILQIPAEKYPEIAEKLKIQFGVDY